MKNLLKQLHRRPINFYPAYRELTGSLAGGILLSQLMYWFSKKDKIYKTDNEIMEETFLSEKELRNAKSKIKKLSFIEVTREGIPAKTYYKIDWEKYEKAFIETYEGQNLNSQKGKTITENTTKITTKTTTYKEREDTLLKKAFEKANIKVLIKDLDIDEKFLLDLVYYREQIGKPLKTVKMLEGMLKDLLTCKIQTGKSVKELFEILEEQGWKSIKPEWVKRLENEDKIKNKDDYDLDDLAKFGYKPSEIIATEVIDNG